MHRRQQERGEQNRIDHSYEPIKSRIYRELVEQERAQKEIIDQKEQEKQKRIEMKYQYDKFIKQVHAPKVDSTKVEELRNRI